MYKVYCHSFDYSKIVASKTEAVETFKQYYLEMLEFVQYSKEWKVKDIAEFVVNAMYFVNDFMNEKINEFHLNRWEWVSAHSQNLNKKFKKNQLTFAAKCGIINIESEVDNID